MTICKNCYTEHHNPSICQNFELYRFPLNQLEFSDKMAEYMKAGFPIGLAAWFVVNFYDPLLSQAILHTRFDTSSNKANISNLRSLLWPTAEVI